MDIRPVTSNDLRTWWGEVELSRTIRGFAVESDSTLLGVAGLIYMPTTIQAFMEMVEGGARYPVTIMRVARLMQALMRTVSAPIFAVADPDYPNSQAFLQRLGFEHVAGRQYVFKKEGR